MDTSSLEPIDQLEPGQKDTSSMELIDYPPTSATSTMPPGSTLVEEENTMITTTASIDNVSFFSFFLDILHLIILLAQFKSNAIHKFHETSRLA